MSTLFAFCAWIEHTRTGVFLRDSTWAFALTETFHLFGIVALVGSTSILDLRFFGRVFRDDPVSLLAKRLLPWAWTGFAVQVVTGSLLFSSEATRCYSDSAFRIKMLLILLAGVNALVFHTFTYKHVARWDADRISPLAARMAGLFSILFWFGIVAAGRWIAYVD